MTAKEFLYSKEITILTCYTNNGTFYINDLCELFEAYKNQSQSIEKEEMLTMAADAYKQPEKLGEYPYKESVATNTTAPVEKAQEEQSVNHIGLWLHHYFQSLRHQKEFHLGLGDIRLTVAMQEEIINKTRKHHD